VSQITIFIIYYYAIYVFPAGEAKLGYLWLNFIGAMLTIVLSSILQLSIFRKEKN
jgi:SSS family solute:Na+ symporter